MNLHSSDFKERASEALRGHRFGASLVMLVAMVFGVFSSSVIVLTALGLIDALIYQYFDGSVGPLIFLYIVTTVVMIFHFFFGGVVNLGYVDYNLALLDRRKAGVGQLFAYFGSWWKTILTRIYLFVVEGIGYLVFIIPGIYLSLNYSMVYYIIEEKPAFSVSKALRMSRRIMSGNRLRYFNLQLSFIPWYLLGFITCGIAFLYVVPYKRAAEAAFYNEISERADVYYGRKQSGHARY